MRGYIVSRGGVDEVVRRRKEASLSWDSQRSACTVLLCCIRTTCFESV